MLNLNIVNISINKIFNKILLIIRVSFFFLDFFSHHRCYTYIFFIAISATIFRSFRSHKWRSFYHDPSKAVLDTRNCSLRGISPIILRYSCINSTNHLLWAVHLRNAFLPMLNLPRVSKIRSKIRFRRVITLIATASPFPYFPSVNPYSYTFSLSFNL